MLVPVIMHASFNSFSDTLTITDHLSGNPLVVNPGGLVGIALLLLTVLAAHALRRRKARPQSMAAPLAASGRSAG